TERNTSKWLLNVYRYRDEKKISKTLNQFDDKGKLDIFLASFLGWLTKKTDGVRIWDKYFFSRALRCLDRKMKSLQNDGYGNTSKSDSLTSDEIISCLNHSYLSIEDNEEGDTYILEYHDLERRSDGGLQLRFCREKNNQGGMLYRQRYGHTESRFIPIHLIKNKNHNGHRTAIMMLKAFDVFEDETMIFSGHGSREGIQAYSSPTDNQRLSSTTLLIPYTSYN
ncbi:12287_t:CDS:2, partial [Cetraspora pellucida]